MTRGEYFLPVSRDEMIDRGWYYYDFLVVTADGYIDHPSFGSTLKMCIRDRDTAPCRPAR